jgi:hypothetical protein
MVLVREGEMGGPYIYEDASPETRIQRSHQMRMLYSLLCNPAGPMSAYIVEVGHCILCVAGWRARRIIIDNDRSNLGEAVPEEIPCAEILKADDNEPLAPKITLNQSLNSALSLPSKELRAPKVLSSKSLPSAKRRKRNR